MLLRNVIGRHYLDEHLANYAMFCVRRSFSHNPIALLQVSTALSQACAKQCIHYGHYGTVRQFGQFINTSSVRLSTECPFAYIRTRSYTLAVIFFVHLIALINWVIFNAFLLFFFLVRVLSFCPLCAADTRQTPTTRNIRGRLTITEWRWTYYEAVKISCKKCRVNYISVYFYIQLIKISSTHKSLTTHICLLLKMQ